MLKVSSAINERYAGRHNYTYRKHVTPFVKGDVHAHLSKVVALSEAAMSGAYDYILYMDADAVIRNMSTSVQDLAKRWLGSDEGILACQGKSWLSWDVNAGVIIVDARKSSALRVLCRWRYRAVFWFGVRRRILRALYGREYSVAWFDDQMHLHRTLLRESDAVVNLRWPDECTFNYNGSFITHRLRSCSHNETVRIQQIRDRVAGDCAP